MAEVYYRTGQAAKQLDVSSYHVRRLCESGAIEAELSAGQQWQIPLAEVERLRREGVPPIPAVAVHEAEESAPEGFEDDDSDDAVEPSGRVVEAADDVRVATSRLQRRRIERESEEVEDWFREREQRQAAERIAERQRNEAAERTRQRQRWVQQWTKYALDSLVPRDAPREVELDVHDNVQAALGKIAEAGGDDGITRRMVSAAVEKALRPWRRRQAVEQAIEAGIARLPWDVRYGPEFAVLRQRAKEAVTSAVGRMREDASAIEMTAAAVVAVRPMEEEYAHRQACEKVVAWVYVSDASVSELKAAKEAVRRAVEALRVGASADQFQKAKETALAPLIATIAKRKEAERRESERRSAGWRADLELSYVADYLRAEYEFDGGYAEMVRECERLRPLVREALVDRLVADATMSGSEIRTAIERFIDDEL